MSKENKKRMVLIMAVGIFIICGICRADGDEKSKRVVVRVAKEIQGEVAGISKDSIAIIYNRNEATGEEYEMSFPVAKEVDIVHKKSINEIAVGDTVNVQYEEILVSIPNIFAKQHRELSIIVGFLIKHNDSKNEICSGFFS